ncbi:hypothetical protein Plhal304r1_c082g0167121 [Plasmopara halstedii]
MYGAIATDTAELQLRLRYMTDTDMLDTAMISCLQMPSNDKPFRFLGVQWLVRGEPSRVKTSSRHHREFVLLVASGVVQHRVSATKIQEIGYHLYQSVKLEECLKDSSSDITRGWISTCTLFVPTRENTCRIDVFSRGFADFKGKMQDYQATNMMTTLMLAGITEATTCGQNKKLSWLLNFLNAAQDFRQRHLDSKRSLKRCGICDRKFNVLTSVASCDLCLINVCSRCRVSHDLGMIRRNYSSHSITQSKIGSENQYVNGQVQCLPATLCKNCKMNASHMDARNMARRDVEAGYSLNETMSTKEESILTMDQRTKPTSSSSKAENIDFGKYIGTLGTTDNVNVRRCDRFVELGATGTNVSRSCSAVQLIDTVKPEAMACRIEKSSTTILETSNGFDLESSFASTIPSQQDRDSNFDESCFEVTTYRSRLQHQPQYASEDPVYVDCSQADLIRRMQQLQMKSESVYQFTSQMNANTQYRYQQAMPFDCRSSSISELD